MIQSRCFRLVVAVIAVVPSGLLSRAAVDTNSQRSIRKRVAPPKPVPRQTIQLEGWTVSIDPRLLEGKESVLGKQAQQMLVRQFQAIKLFVPADKVKRLQKVCLWLDLSQGLLVSPQYHVSRDWLRTNGHPEALVQCVHIPSAAYFADPYFQHQQPWCVMHELAHAYHDQVLGFDNAEIVAAWKRFKDSGRYDSVLHIDGKKRKHYALTNQMEFFAEMTETYFGQNDFYPFNRAELLRVEPEVFTLMQKVWGPLPGPKRKRKKVEPTRLAFIRSGIFTGGTAVPRKGCAGAIRGLPLSTFISSNTPPHAPETFWNEKGARCPGVLWHEQSTTLTSDEGQRHAAHHLGRMHSIEKAAPRPKEGSASGALVSASAIRSRPSGAW